jgi:hypothetical protein
MGRSPIFESLFMAANATRLARSQVLGVVVTEPFFKPSELIHTPQSFVNKVVASSENKRKRLVCRFH